MSTPAVRRYLSELGKKGAKATNSQMSKDELKQKMSKAAKARWAKEKKGKS